MEKVWRNLHSKREIYIAEEDVIKPNRRKNKNAGEANGSQEQEDEKLEVIDEDSDEDEEFLSFVSFAIVL